MIHFSDLTQKDFLENYWQKKPLLIKGGLPNFSLPLSAEEMAGLSLEEEVESRIIVQHSPTDYELKRGPFTEDDYAALPEKDWTLLIQGMDRLIPEVTDILDDFSFIPRWRIDDIMVSYATEGGNVGPHFDHYDVFLIQGQGKRQWQLTSQNCEESNYIQGVDIRLMDKYEVEDTYVCEPGDVLYLPPKWGHHGVGLTDDCMTFSVGYRTYKGLELWDSFGDYLAENDAFKTLYQDPSWNNCEAGQVSDESWQQAKKLLLTALDNETHLKEWFGRFATQLDSEAVQQLPEPLAEDEISSKEDLVDALSQCEGIIRDPVCRFAYTEMEEKTLLNINGAIWNDFGAEADFIKMLCNQRLIPQDALQIILQHEGNQLLLNDLWELQFFEIID